MFLFLLLLQPILAQNVQDDLNKYQERYQNASRKSRVLPSYNFPQALVEDGEKFDFIIVGSGPAGSVLANRLSENPQWKVLLLEVGDEDPVITDVPVLAPLFQFTDLNWGYLMEKQENVCLGLVDQRMAWPRGRGLGGTSLINYMIHVRGNRRDYNRWAKMGNPGWSYKNLFKYFTKSEDCFVKIRDDSYRGFGGNIAVQDVPYRTESVEAFIKAAQEMGHPYVDYNGKQQMGVSYVQATTKRGRRWDAAKAYLEPVKNRTNLQISTKSRVVKILIDKEFRVALGVEYVKNRRHFKALAGKEVILSAGAFNSPQLLMLSGIGPREHLEEFQIPVLQDLPVGRKLYDHITFLGLTFTVNQSIVSRQEIVEDPKNFLELALNGTGPLTGLGGVEALLYFKTNISKETKNYPDMELIFVAGGMHTDRGQYYRKTFRISNEIYDAVWKPLENQFAFSVLPMLIHPKSFGYLKLKSKNPYHWPKLYGNYFTDPRNEDVKTFIAAIREVQKLVKAKAFQKYDTKQVKTPIPGCQDLVFDSDEYWECALRHVTATLHHQVATCKMGARDDPEAVVDSESRVYGVKNLRVADTSVIPIPLSAHTNIPSFIVGERAADVIKEEWGMAPNIDIRAGLDDI